jgi:hypothetical protein
MGLLDTDYQDQRLTASQKKKIKPAIQGGGYNYLGKQETVTVPKKWLSDPDHVVAELAYITPREKKVLIDLNMYGSLDGKPNNAPGGLDSLQGDMGSVGGGGTGGNNDGGGSGGGGGGQDASRPDFSPPSSNTTTSPGSDDGYVDRIQRISQGIEPGFTPTSNRPFGQSPEEAYIEGKITKDQYEETIARTQEIPDQRNLLEKTVDLYQKYSPFGLLSKLFTGDAKNIKSNDERGGGGDRDLMTQLTPYAPYAITDTTPQQSMVNQYFSNLGMSNQPLSSSLQTDYNNAKTNINSLLGILPPSQQFGYSDQPYGLLSSENLASNPFNIDYLQERGLI